MCQLQFPIIKLVCNMHNNINSTYFGHFWSNIKTNKSQKKCTPILFSQKSSTHTDTAAFSRRTTHDTMHDKAKKICCTITHITKMHHCPLSN